MTGLNIFVILLIGSVQAGYVDKYHLTHIYRLFDTTATWEGAASICTTHAFGLDPKLATIETDTENNFVKAFVSGHTWIGITDEGHEGNWKTISNTSQQFFDWALGQPDNSSNENCGHLHAGLAMRWSDSSCSDKYFYLCEAEIDQLTTLIASVPVIGSPFIEWSIKEPQKADEKRELVLNCNTASMTLSLYDSTPQIKWYKGKNNPKWYSDGPILDDATWRERMTKLGRKVSCRVIGKVAGQDATETSEIYEIPNQFVKISRRSATHILEGDCSEVTTLQQIPFICTDQNDCELELVTEVVDVQQFQCDNSNISQINVYIGGNCNKNIIYGTGSSSAELKNFQKSVFPVCGSFDGKYDTFHTSKVIIYGRDVTDQRGIADYWLEQLVDFQLVVQDLDMTLQGTVCYSTNDPHMTTFDDVRYEMQMEGVFYLYEHKIDPVNVQVKFGKCNSRAYCNCALAVVAWDGYFIYDSCDGTKKAPQFYQDHQNLNVNTNDPTADYIIKVKTGTVIKILHAGHTWFNVQIIPSYGDRNNVEGLCGNFDTNTTLTNEFYIEKWSKVDPVLVRKPRHYGDHDFGRAARVDPVDNVIEGCPKDIVEANPVYEKQCTCVFETALGDEKELCEPHQGAVPECFTDKPYNAEPRYRDQPCVNRKKRQIVDDTANATLNETIEFTNGWNETTAYEYCEDAILNSSISTLCADVPGIDLNRSIFECYQDIMLSGDTDYLDFTISAIFTGCLTEILKNVTVVNENVSISDNFTVTNLTAELSADNLTETLNETAQWVAFEIPDEFVAIFCGPFCDRHGECGEGGVCQCNPGYFGRGCEIEYSRTPTIRSISNCDHYNCTEMTIEGNDFTDVIDGVLCSVLITQMDERGSKSVQQQVVNATFTVPELVTCTLPEIDPAFATMIEIEATNNGFNTTSNTTSFLIMKECISCSDGSLESCQLEDAFCFIESVCIPANLSSDCLDCIPEAGRYQFTNTCTEYTSTPLYIAETSSSTKMTSTSATETPTTTKTVVATTQKSTTTATTTADSSITTKSITSTTPNNRSIIQMASSSSTMVTSSTSAQTDKTSPATKSAPVNIGSTGSTSTKVRHTNSPTTSSIRPGVRSTTGTASTISTDATSITSTAAPTTPTTPTTPTAPTTPTTPTTPKKITTTSTVGETSRETDTPDLEQAMKIAGSVLGGVAGIAIIITVAYILVKKFHAPPREQGYDPRPSSAQRPPSALIEDDSVKGKPPSSTNFRFDHYITDTTFPLNSEQYAFAPRPGGKLPPLTDKMT